MFSHYFTTQSLNENFRQAKDWMLKNEIVQVPKIGQFKPFILQPSSEPTTEIKPGQLDSDKIKILTDVDYKLGSLGFGSQTIPVIFIDFDHNKEELKQKYPKMFATDITYSAFVDPGIRSIFVDTNPAKHSVIPIQHTLIHEVAHLIWIQLNKETKEWFIDWYKHNVLSPVIKQHQSENPRPNKLTDNQISDILYNFNKNKTNKLSHDLDVILPASILMDDVQIKNHIRDNIKSAVKRDKTVLYDNSKLTNILKRISIPQKKYDALDLPDYESDQLREIAHKKGLVPSEYAASNAFELWAETVAYAADNIKSISPELKKALNQVISGVV
jgi:hypothetical protein